MIWKSTHLSILNKVSQLTYIRTYQSEKPSREVEGTACRAQRQDCVETQIWGRLQKVTTTNDQDSWQLFVTECRNVRSKCGEALSPHRKKVLDLNRLGPFLSLRAPYS